MKTAIVLSGGGMCCSYSAGAIVALAQRLNFTKPDMIVAASGSVGTMFYYIAGQYQSIEGIWTKALANNKDFVSFSRRQIMDIDYLIDDVFKKQYPLDSKAISKSDINFYVSVRNSKTGKRRYISREDNLDVFEVTRATMAMPIIFGEEIKLNDNYYIRLIYVSSN